MRTHVPPVRAPHILPADFVPSNYDVICGKGKRAFDHVGNRRFRITIDLHLPKYEDAKIKAGKTAIVHNIVNIVREASNTGFVKHNKKMNRWIEVGDVTAKEKVGQAIRDALAQRDPERRKAKVAMRRQKRNMQGLLDQAICPSTDTAENSTLAHAKAHYTDGDEDSRSSFEDEPTLRQYVLLSATDEDSWFRLSLTGDAELPIFPNNLEDNESDGDEPKKQVASV